MMPVLANLNVTGPGTFRVAASSSRDEVECPEAGSATGPSAATATASLSLSTALGGLIGTSLT